MERVALLPRHGCPCLSARVLAYLCIRQVAKACAITRQLCLQSGLALGFRSLALGFCHPALYLDGDPCGVGSSAPDNVAQRNQRASTS